MYRISTSLTLYRKVAAEDVTVLFKALRDRVIAFTLSKFEVAVLSQMIPAVSQVDRSRSNALGTERITVDFDICYCRNETHNLGSCRLLILTMKFNIQMGYNT